MARQVATKKIKKAVGDCLGFDIFNFICGKCLSMAAPAVIASPAAVRVASIVVTIAAIAIMTAIEAAITAAAPRKAKADFRLGIIHRGGSNINRLLVDVNRLWAYVNGLRGSVNNRLLINANGLLINVNRLISGFKSNTYTETISATAISRYGTCQNRQY